MCLVVVALRPDADYPVLIAANRDERQDRPADPLGWWSDRPGVLAGRDRLAGGTWLGVGTDGRFGTVLNDRRFAAPAGAPSRGGLVPELLGAHDPVAWLDGLVATRHRYAGFHLLAGFGGAVHYCASAAEGAVRLGPGLHTIDNAGLDIDDPRSRRARSLFADADAGAAAPEDLLQRLADTTGPGDGDGDRRPVFIADPVFGTRCSTVLRFDADGGFLCHERRFDADGAPVGETAVAWPAPVRMSG